MTKTISSKPATTKQLKDTEKRLRQDFQQEIRATAAKLATKEEVYTKKDHAKFVKELFGIFCTKQDLEESMREFREDMQKKYDAHTVILDRILTEVESTRKEQLFHGNQLMRVEETVADHEKRIHVLEA